MESPTPCSPRRHLPSGGLKHGVAPSACATPSRSGRRPGKPGLQADNGPCLQGGAIQANIGPELSVMTGSIGSTPIRQRVPAYGRHLGAVTRRGDGRSGISVVPGSTPARRTGRSQRCDRRPPDSSSNRSSASRWLGLLGRGAGNQVTFKGTTLRREAPCYIPG